jgi:hypothetical protein
VITFTSSSTVNNFVKIMGRNFSLPKSVKIACIGPVTAAAAKKAGFPVDIHQEEYTMEGLVGALINYFCKNRRHEKEARANDRNFQTILRSGGASRCPALQQAIRAIAFTPPAIFSG